MAASMCQSGNILRVLELEVSWREMTVRAEGKRASQYIVLSAARCFGSVCAVMTRP